MKKVITIAGSDSSGGAGIQSDLKTFAALGVYGASVITAVTAQNSVGVFETMPLPAAMVARQIEVIAEDLDLNGAKTGMLFDREIITAVSTQIKKFKISPLVIDPVMLSKSGHYLLMPEARQTLIEQLFPLSAVVTPNIEEAEALSGVTIQKIEDMEKAARVIKQMGPEAVVIKGGHLREAPVDLLYDGASFYHFEGERIPVKNDKIHGIGCTFSAALTAFLAQDMNFREAVQAGKKFAEECIRNALDIGKGNPVPNHLGRIIRDGMRYGLIQEMLDALEKMKRADIGELIPEVQSNIAAALPGAKDHSDIAGFPGRLVKFGQSIMNIGYPQFGVSKHVANIVLAAMKYNPEKRTAMNIRYSAAILDAARRLNFTVSSFDRTKEPQGVKSLEGSSLEWGTEEAIKAFGSVPDLIYDLGDVGKEPMIRVIAESPTTLGEKILKLKKSLDSVGKDIL